MSESFRVSAFNHAPSAVAWVSPEDRAEFDERSPLFVVTAAEDPEGDIPTYRFLIDQRATLDSPDVVEIRTEGVLDEDGNVVVDLSAFEEPVVLPDGADYWARVRAEDSEGMGGSWAQVRFHVNREPLVDDGNSRVGCGAEVAAARAPGSRLVLLLVGLVGLRARRARGARAD